MVPPQLLFQVPPGFLGPALQNPVPQNPPQAEGGPEKVTMYHTPKKGVGLGMGHIGSFFSSLLAAAPAFPKQQVPPGWGPTDRKSVV